MPFQSIDAIAHRNVFSALALAGGFVFSLCDGLQDEQLVEAVKGGDAAEVGRLLEDGADPEAKDRNRYGYGNPALMLAAEGGHLDALKLLHRHGAKLEATNAHGATALTFAAWQGKPDCTKALLEWGADVEAASNTTNISLHLAGRPTLALKHPWPTCHVCMLGQPPEI